MYPMMTLSSFEAELYRSASALKVHLLGHALYLVFKDRFTYCESRLRRPRLAFRCPLTIVFRLKETVTLLQVTRFVKCVRV